MASENIRIKIEGIDKLTPVLERLDKTLNKLNSTLSRFSNISSRAFQKVGSSAKKSVKGYKDLRKEAIKTINEISEIHKKAQRLSGLKFLSEKELGRLGGLQRKLNTLKKKLSIGDKVYVENYEYKTLKQREINLKEFNRKALNLYKKRLYAESKWIEWLSKEEDRYLKHRLRLIENSNKIEERQLKKKIILHERYVNSIMQSARYEGGLGVIDYLKGRSKLLQHKRDLQIAVSKGFISQEEAELRNRKLVNQLKHLNRTIGTTNSKLHEWWKRFGAVALGFTLVYRAMLYFEMGLGMLIDQIRQGILAFDQFQEATVRLSMFYEIFAGIKNTSKSFDYAVSSIEALKVATVTALSPIQDITQGIDELAQHGVFLSASMMQDFVNLTDFIGMIAKTTGSQANQIRQELQALFEGTKRAGNTLIRFLSKLFGDKFVRELQKSRTPLEQFYKIMTKISDYVGRHKEQLFAKSFTLSLQKAQNIFKLIINDAISLTSIMKGLTKDTNIFAKILNDTVNKLGFDAYVKMQSERMRISDLITKQIENDVELNNKFKELEGKYGTRKAFDLIVPEVAKKDKTGEISKYLSEYNNQLDRFSNTPAFKVLQSLSKLFNLLATDILPKIINVIPSLINGFIDFIVNVKALYRAYKPLIDTITTAVKYLILFKVTLATVRFIINEPINLLVALSRSFFRVALASLVGAKGLLAFLLRTKLVSKALNFILLRARLFSVAFLGIMVALWTVTYAILHPEKFKKLFISIFASIGEVITRYAVKILEKFQGWGTKIVYELMKPADAMAELVINLNKVHDKLVPDSFVRKAEAFRKAIQSIDKSNPLGGFINTLKDANKYWNNLLEETGNPFDNIVDAIKTTANDIKPVVVKIGKVLVDVSKDVGKKVFGKFLDEKNNLINELEGSKNKIKNYIYDLFKIETPINMPKQTSIEELTKQIRQIADEYKYLLDVLEFGKQYGMITQEDYYNKVLSLLEEQKQKYIEYLNKVVAGSKEELDAKNRILEIDRKIYEIRTKIKQVGIGTDKKELEKLVNAYEEIIRKANEYGNARTTATIFSDDNISFIDAINERIDRLREKISTIKDVKLRQQLQDDLENAINKFEELKENARKTQKELGGSVRDIFYDVSESIVVELFSTFKVVKTGIKNLADEIQNILGDQLYNILAGKFKGIKDLIGQLGQAIGRVLTQILAQLIMMKTMSMMMSAMTGTPTTASPPPIPTAFPPKPTGFATGGVVSSPTLALIGEGKYKEAVVPLPDGRSIPAKVIDNSSKQATEVNIVNVVDPNIVGDYLASLQGQNMILNVVANNKYRLRKILS